MIQSQLRNKKVILLYRKIEAQVEVRLKGKKQSLEVVYRHK